MSRSAKPAADLLDKLRGNASPEAWATALDLLLRDREGFAEAAGATVTLFADETTAN